MQKLAQATEMTIIWVEGSFSELSSLSPCIVAGLISLIPLPSLIDEASLEFFSEGDSTIFPGSLFPYLLFLELHNFSTI